MRSLGGATWDDGSDATGVAVVLLVKALPIDSNIPGVFFAADAAADAAEDAAAATAVAPCFKFAAILGENLLYVFFAASAAAEAAEAVLEAAEIAP